MNDELVQEDMHSNDQFQESKIKDHCTGIEEQIRSAASESEALRIIERSCRSFEADCDSDVIKSALRHHLSGLLKKYW